MAQINAYRSARVLIGRYGATAEAEARAKLEEVAHKGALARTATWWRILAAVQDLQRAQPPAGEEAG